MRQAYIPYIKDYEDEDDTPMEGKKSCVAEAYQEGMYQVSESSSSDSQKLLN